MERIKLVALFIIPFLLLSCSSASGSALDYEALPFTARFSIFINDTNFTGTVAAGAATENTPRDVRLIFESPKSLSGISVERKNGETLTSFEGITLPTDSSRWLEIAELFSLGGTVASAKSSIVGGTPCTLVTVTAKNGEKYSVYIDKTGLPLRICGELWGKPFTLDVIFFRQDV